MTQDSSPSSNSGGPKGERPARGDAHACAPTSCLLLLQWGTNKRVTYSETLRNRMSVRMNESKNNATDTWLEPSQVYAKELNESLFPLWILNEIQNL